MSMCANSSSWDHCAMFRDNVSLNRMSHENRHVADHSVRVKPPTQWVTCEPHPTERKIQPIRHHLAAGPPGEPNPNLRSKRNCIFPRAVDHLNFVPRVAEHQNCNGKPDGTVDSICRNCFTIITTNTCRPHGSFVTRAGW